MYSKSCSGVTWVQPQFVIAETATLERKDDQMHVMIYAMCGTHGIFVISQKPFTVYKIETGLEPKVDNASDWHGIKKDLLYREERNQIIIDLVMKNLGYKILILTLEIEHVLLLYEKLKDLKISCDYMCKTKKSYSDSTVLVGTVSKIGTGFDEASFCPNYNGIPINFLILAGSIKNAALIEQNVGRAFRSEHPLVFDLVDDHPITKRHFNERRKWYTSRNGKINALQMTGGLGGNGGNGVSGVSGVEVNGEVVKEEELDDDRFLDLPDDYEDWTESVVDSTLHTLVANGGVNIGGGYTSGVNIGGGYTSGVNIGGVNTGGVNTGGVNTGYTGGVNTGYTGGVNTGYTGGVNTGYTGGVNTGYTGGVNTGVVNTGYTGVVNTGYTGVVNTGYTGVVNTGYTSVANGGVNTSGVNTSGVNNGYTSEINNSYIPHSYTSGVNTGYTSGVNNSYIPHSYTGAMAARAAAI